MLLSEAMTNPEIGETGAMKGITICSVFVVIGFGEVSPSLGSAGFVVNGLGEIKATSSREVFTVEGLVGDCGEAESPPSGPVPCLL